MAIRAILFLICVASLVQARIPGPRRYSHGKTLFCYLTASESYDPNLQLSPTTLQHCTHFILNKYSIKTDSFDIYHEGGAMNLRIWRMNMRVFRITIHAETLLEVYWPDFTSEDLRRIPRDLGETWVKLLTRYRLNGIIFRFSDNTMYTNLPTDENIQYLLRHVYGEFQRNNMLLILEDYSCSIGTSLRTIEVDYLISNCEIPLDKCVHDKYIESSPENIKFTNFHDIPNSKIIREYTIYGQKRTITNINIATYSEICDIIVSKNLNVRNEENCLKKISYYANQGRNSLETFVFDDTETIMKKLKYFVSSGINGILLRKRDLDDTENKCMLDNEQLVPGTWGRYPLLKAVTIGILQGAIDEWMKLQN